MGDIARRALVIGYGSPIPGDDAIGPLAADRLEAEGVPGHVQVVSRQYDTVLAVLAQEGVRAGDHEQGTDFNRLACPNLNAPKGIIFALSRCASGVGACCSDQCKHR